ncbi:LGFP repeat-containing protein, partial [Actinopolyspora mzabensis]|uniref:LGFP repeat-containing protein n=1 Tax=Actinopolyspora mzabensis TaxID=995066 RepID=UPI00115F7CE8
MTVKNLVGRAVALSTAAALVTAAPAAGATEQPEQSTPTTQSSQQAESGDDSTQDESGSETGAAADSSGSGDSTSDEDSGSSDASGSGDDSTDGSGSGSDSGSGTDGSGATDESDATGDSGSGSTDGSTDGSGSNDSASGDATGSGNDSGSESGSESGSDSGSGASGDGSADDGDQVDEDPGAGKIDEYYQSLSSEEQQRLGDPVGDEQLVSDSLRYQKYDNARIYWSAEQGVHSVSGAVLDAFVNAGGHEAIGVPATNVLADDLGTPYGEFVSSERGTSAIYAPEDAEAHVLGEPVLRKWRAEGGGSQLGYPTTDTAATADGRGQYSEFANGGVIYWTAETQAHVLRGRILAKWEETGGGAGPLGYPTTDTTATPGNTGQYNHFENNGSIYWS